MEGEDEKEFQHKLPFIDTTENIGMRSLRETEARDGVCGGTEQEGVAVLCHLYQSTVTVSSNQLVAITSNLSPCQSAQQVILNKPVRVN